MSAMPIRLASHILIGLVMAFISLHAKTGLVAWSTLFVAVALLLPRLMVEVPDEDRALVVQAFRDALMDCGLSLKAAAIDMALHSPADLLHALARERQCDLFFRMLRLPLEVRRAFHLNCVLALGLPERTKRMLKVAAVLEPLTTERSA